MLRDQCIAKGVPLLIAPPLVSVEQDCPYRICAVPALFVFDSFHSRLDYCRMVTAFEIVDIKVPILPMFFESSKEKCDITKFRLSFATDKNSDPLLTQWSSLAHYPTRGMAP